MQKQFYNWKFLIGISLITAMGGLLFGYDWVVIGGAKAFYEPFSVSTKSKLYPYFPKW